IGVPTSRPLSVRFRFGSSIAVSHKNRNVQRSTPNAQRQIEIVRRSMLDVGCSILGVRRFLRGRRAKLGGLFLARERAAEFFHPCRKPMAILLAAYHCFAGHPVELDHPTRPREGLVTVPRI